MDSKPCTYCNSIKQLAEFPRNMHAPDGSRHSSMCKACLAAHDLHRELHNERSRDIKWAHPLQVQRRERLAEVAALKERLAAEKEALAARTKVCRRCGITRSAVDFPKNRYNMAAGEYGRSRLCGTCIGEMPDGKAELARERSRDYHRVLDNPQRATALMLAESSLRYRDRREAQADRRDTIEAIEVVVGGDAEAFLAMTPAERLAAMSGLLGEE